MERIFLRIVYYYIFVCYGTRDQYIRACKMSFAARRHVLFCTQSFIKKGMKKPNKKIRVHRIVGNRLICIYRNPTRGTPPSVVCMCIELLYYLL